MVKPLISYERIMRRFWKLSKELEVNGRFEMGRMLCQQLFEYTFIINSNQIQNIANNGIIKIDFNHN